MSNLCEGKEGAGKADEGEGDDDLLKILAAHHAQQSADESRASRQIKAEGGGDTATICHNNAIGMGIPVVIGSSLSHGQVHAAAATAAAMAVGKTVDTESDTSQLAVESEATLPGAHAVGGPDQSSGDTAGADATAARHTGALSERDTEDLHNEHQGYSQEDDIDALALDAVLVVDEQPEEPPVVTFAPERAESVVASIDDDDIEVQVLAIPSKRRAVSPFAKRIFSFVLFLGVIIAVIVIVTTVVGSSGDSTATAPYYADPNGGPNPNEGPVIYAAFSADILFSETIKTIQEDLFSPQYLANKWMVKDPNLDSYSKQRLMQRFGFAILWFSTNGPEWYRSDNWMEYDVHECLWYSSSPEPSICDDDIDDNTITIIDLHGNNLEGGLPKEAFTNTKVRIMNISRNRLTGQYPLMLTASSKVVEVIDMSFNDFEGPLVADPGFVMPKIKVIRVNSNRIQGDSTAIAPAFLQLEIMNATDNWLSGTISPFIGFATNIQYLGFGHNRYVGAVTTQLGKLTALQGLDLSGNDLLVGNLPSEIGLLTSLTELYIAETGLSGPLAPEAGSLEALAILNMEDTLLTGTIPMDLCVLHANVSLELTVDCDLIQCCGLG